MERYFVRLGGIVENAGEVFEALEKASIPCTGFREHRVETQYGPGTYLVLDTQDRTSGTPTVLARFGYRELTRAAWELVSEPLSAFPGVDLDPFPPDDRIPVR